jgi:hypothetical protein
MIKSREMRTDNSTKCERGNEEMFTGFKEQRCYKKIKCRLEKFNKGDRAPNGGGT